MSGNGEYADQIAQMFSMAKNRHGFKEKLPPLAVDRFRVPRKQLSLFEG
jgi:hypothetical protein